MTFNPLPAFGAALLSGGLAGIVYFKDTRSFVHRTFAAGMAALLLEGALTGLSLLADLPEEVVRWQRLRVVATALLPGSWLLFSLAFARAEYKEFVARLRAVACAAFALPLALATLFSGSIFVEAPALSASSGWLLRLGWSGYAFYLLCLLIAVLILMNLERTLRASTGSKRWRIKFMILGLGGLFAIRIYTISQTLLFSSVNPALEVVNAGSVIVADVLITLSLLRNRLSNLDIYVSKAFLYNSFTVLFVGIYLLVIGLLAKGVSYLGGSHALPLTAFFVFLTLLGLTIVLLSDQQRQKIQRLISRHFQRPRYDYRKEWTTFTRRTASLLDTKDLCSAVTRMVSETFGVSSVTIWLPDEMQGQLVLGGSTVFSETQARGLATARTGAPELIRAMRDQQMPVDFHRPTPDWPGELARTHPDFFREARVRYCVLLTAGGEFLGLMTLNEGLTEGPLSVEAFDLLKTIADQAAVSLLNLKLSAGILRAKEIETFQSMVAFFLHDLKNLASRLSLTLENLPVHYDNPAFRTDMLRMMSQSVTRINAMCSRLSLLGQTLQLQQTEADLNELATSTLASLKGCLRASLVHDLRPVPRLMLDREQIQKVLVNLILNSNDAVKDGGEIRVATEQRDGWVVLSVSDNGCGMPKAFMEHSLFRPFQTTKKQGLGIGLFHSKMIVEAHQGRIDVESEEGKGSTFRVILPGSREGS